jgi:hypothetical protein
VVLWIFVYFLLFFIVCMILIRKNVGSNSKKDNPNEEEMSSGLRTFMIAFNFFQWTYLFISLPINWGTGVERGTSWMSFFNMEFTPVSPECMFHGGLSYYAKYYMAMAMPAISLLVIAIIYVGHLAYRKIRNYSFMERAPLLTASRSR